MNGKTPVHFKKIFKIELLPMIFNRSLERIRGLLGGIIILFSLIFLIPGIVLLVSSGMVYGSPMTGYPIGKEIPTDGQIISIDLPMTKGNNYDVKYQLKTFSSLKGSNSTFINVFVNSSSVNGQLKDLPKGTFKDRYFNESTLNGINAFKTNLQSDEILIMTFQVTSSQNIDKTIIYVSLYQNPNRELSSIMGTIGILIMLPGIVIFIIGAIVAGKDRNSRRKSKKIGKGTIYIDI